MEDEILKQIQKEKIQKMKNPTVLMNKTDLKALVKSIEEKVENFKVGVNFKMAGIPIYESWAVETGKFIVYDAPITW